MKYTLILIAILTTISCNKVVTTDRLVGTYTLSSIKEKKLFSCNDVTSPYTNATFIYETNNILTIITDNDTLTGNYSIYTTTNYNNDENGSQHQEQNISHNAVNITGNKRFLITLNQVQFKNKNKTVEGRLAQPGSDYIYTFTTKQ